MYWNRLWWFRYLNKRIRTKIVFSANDRSCFLGVNLEIYQNWFSSWFLGFCENFEVLQQTRRRSFCPFLFLQIVRFEWFWSIIQSYKSCSLEFINQMFPAGNFLFFLEVKGETVVEHDLDYRWICSWLIKIEVIKTINRSHGDVLISWFVWCSSNLSFKWGFFFFPCIEDSLSGIDPFMLKIHNEIRRVDATILASEESKVSFALYMYVLTTTG